MARFDMPPASADGGAVLLKRLDTQNDDGSKGYRDIPWSIVLFPGVTGPLRRAPYAASASPSNVISQKGSESGGISRDTARRQGARGTTDGGALGDRLLTTQRFQIGEGQR